MSYFDVIFLMYLVSSGFSFKPTSSSSSSTQFSQEWARRKVVVKHSIKSNSCENIGPKLDNWRWPNFGWVLLNVVSWPWPTSGPLAVNWCCHWAASGVVVIAGGINFEGGGGNLRNASVIFSLFWHEACLGWH